MMKYIKFIFFIVGITGCTVQNPAFYQAHGSQFEDKYQSHIGPNEQVVKAWYHYVKTQDASGNYILRTFIPETKQITSEVRFNNSQLTIMDGPSRYWHENGNIKSEGVYQNNLTEGEWKFYHRVTGNLSSKGKFVSNYKEGLWKYYDGKGRLSSESTYQQDIKEGSFIEYDSLKTIINEGIYQADTIFQQTKIDTIISSYHYSVKEEMPYLSQCKSIDDLSERSKCSSRAFLTYIYKTLKYPPKARKYGIVGTTMTQFVIDDDGQIEDIDVVIGLCQEIKDECKRVISNMPQWEPGEQDGKKVRVLYTIPIKFNLE